MKLKLQKEGWRGGGERRRRRQGGREGILEEITAKSFPNFMKSINTKIQEAESYSSTINNVREHYNLETIAEKKLKKTYIHQREIPYS